uniref:Uncharacterized protein n=1 Tax=Leersia perrieri TaxID=77586 RepID=A0A0D9WCM2_9ORYZ
MSGGGSNIRVSILDGEEVHVERVDKIEVKKAGDLNVDEIAADFIRRKKEAFQRANKQAAAMD